MTLAWYLRRKATRRTHSIRKIMAFFFHCSSSLYSRRACVSYVYSSRAYSIPRRRGENRHHNNHKLLPFCRRRPPDEPNTIRVYIVRIICIILLCHRVLMVFLSFDLFREFSRSREQGRGDCRGGVVQ